MSFLAKNVDFLARNLHYSYSNQLIFDFQGYDRPSEDKLMQLKIVVFDAFFGGSSLCIAAKNVDLFFPETTACMVTATMV